MDIPHKKWFMLASMHLCPHKVSGMQHYSMRLMCDITLYRIRIRNRKIRNDIQRKQNIDLALSIVFAPSATTTGAGLTFWMASLMMRNDVL